MIGFKKATPQEEEPFMSRKPKRMKGVFVNDGYDATRNAADLTIAAKRLRKTRGLLCTQPHKENLLLMSCNDIHTAGMRHAIDVAFVDQAGCVIESHCSVKPLRRLHNRRAVAVVERFSSCVTPWFSVGDQLMISIKKEVDR